MLKGDLETVAAPSRSITSLVVAGAGWMLAWRMISRLLGFVSLLVLAGLLSPSDFGVVAVATSISGAIDGLSSLGVRDALLRLREDSRHYYDTAFTFQVARGVLSGLLIAGAGWFAVDLFEDARLRVILPILALVVILGSIENIGMVKFSRVLNFQVQFLVLAGPRLFGFLTTTTLAILLHSYWAMIIGTLVGKIVATGSTYIISPHRPSFGLKGWKYLLSFSFWTWMGGLAVTVLQRVDPFLLSPILGTASFGLYILALEIAFMPVTELLEPSCSALFPGFAMARREGADPIGIALSVAGALMLMIMPFSAGISATSGYLVNSLLGPQWQQAQPLIAVLAWTCIFLPFSHVTVTLLSARGQLKRVFVGHTIAAAIKVAAVLAVRNTRDLTLISQVATCVTAAEAVMFIVQLWAAGNREIRMLAMVTMRGVAALAVTCVALWFVPGTWQTLTLDRMTATLAGGAIGLLTFGVFFSVNALLWNLAGRPGGAEQRLYALIYHNPRVSTLVEGLMAWARQ